MDVTFISIHDMSQNARILYASDSIEYILGYLPHEVINKSCWDYFHPEEMPFAQSVHGRGVQLDKAAVLRYCRVKHKLGFWVCCECVFSVVYNVLVACTSVYHQGASSQKRAADAPIIRRMFTSSPRDPRYHMLSYLSNKFTQLPTTTTTMSTTASTHEPRAALFLNRFSRALTIMFVTDGITEILGLAPQQLVSKSFYFCIQERSLRDAVRCLESAKANDSIAYLRFWYRNPLEEDAPHNSFNQASRATLTTTELGANPIQSGFGSEMSPSQLHSPQHQPESIAPIELEAVVSCTSDGLVVVLRRARPSIPLPQQKALTMPNGLFASPWATQPILPQYHHHHHTPAVQIPIPTQAVWNQQGYPTYNFATSSSYPSHSYGHGHGPATMVPAPVLPSHTAAGGPHPQELFGTIRDVAVFAWGIVGINGSLEQYKQGQPSGDALPPDGILLWNPKQEDSKQDEQKGFAAEDQTKDRNIKVEEGDHGEVV